VLFFLLIVGVPFVIALVAFFNPDSLENLIREPGTRVAPPVNPPSEPA
jgi:hypothetical protein